MHGLLKPLTLSYCSELVSCIDVQLTPVRTAGSAYLSLRSERHFFISEFISQVTTKGEPSSHRELSYAVTVRRALTVSASPSDSASMPTDSSVAAEARGKPHRRPTRPQRAKRQSRTVVRVEAVEAAVRAAVRVVARAAAARAAVKAAAVAAVRVVAWAAGARAAAARAAVWVVAARAAAARAAERVAAATAAEASAAAASAGT